ncbi:glycosyltransferase family 4 protein [Lipingzhangella sp. LS1_29]|uniref:Glycosyltransferase family 4 protein n=1 Tax=Lipingzhangella rawalii TaxID=2055835 RepID=A0ABU2H5U1_9ACTN|nr:glycosyltransferase family 4 protein [Lipingzhangella rawalii]MDS1270377.1 glycosyltransferase family 4 protein [Lipingzhangella rawalii]
MRIAILIGNGYGMGGTIRTVVNLAHALGTHHDVEIVSLVQQHEQPFFELPAGVGMRNLVPSRSWPARPAQGWPDRVLERIPSPHLPRAEARGRGALFNVRTERALRRYLSATDADVVIGTRPGLNLLLARWAPRSVLRIGQEHVHFSHHSGDTRGAIQRWYPRLDGLTVLTEADRRDYAAALRPESGWLTTMPNPLPPGDYPRSRLENPIVGAVSRITPIKQFPKLLEAFGKATRDRPDWQLRIYGRGQSLPQVRRAILDLGLHNQVALMGPTADVFGELAKCSVVGVSSRAEGFGMSIVEAFAVGVPVVSFDCPHGPAEIITHDHNGLLVANQDVSALAAGLAQLMENTERRRRMGAAARATSVHYSPDVIADRWDAYLRQRITARHGQLRVSS